MTTASTAHPDHHNIALRNDPKKVAVASMIGTAIEFYDYYIYAAAAVLIFNTQFFDKTDEKAAMLYSLSTLALAFIPALSVQHYLVTLVINSVVKKPWWPLCSRWVYQP